MKRETKNRIPIHFVDDGGGNARAGAGEQSSPEEPDAAGDFGANEVGRVFLDQDAADIASPVDHGPQPSGVERHKRSENEDVAGALDQVGLPEMQGNRTAAPPFVENRNLTIDEAVGNSRAPGQGPPPNVASGPAFAELLATRAELNRIEAELRKATAERQDAIDRLARVQADFENHRKRVERERSETYNRVLGEIVGRLLPVTDNLRRALDARESMRTDDSAGFRHFLQGIDLINKQLSGMLESLGVETVPTVGQPFDPHIHEAAATEQTNRFPPDTVIEEVVPGYVLGGKLLRPAIVKVAIR